MNRDIATLCKNCLDCQQSKISRHVKFISNKIIAPDGRFDHLHIDIIGPLTVYNEYRYCLTIINRISRSAGAILMKDITAQTVTRAFYDNWVARYGCPKILSTNQGSQFESRLFTVQLDLLGCKRIRTTVYHPAANGLFELWHRSLKSAIMCHSDMDWTRVLSTVLLGLRTHVRLDTGASPAKVLYGTTLGIPGQFFVQEDFFPEPNIFLQIFHEFMREVKPVLTLILFLRMYLIAKVTFSTDVKPG
ncbi:uncharacterized protein LOC117174547 [Belonocnema kinseyi]|uniref:uncharacterized protein LOC117174547 n=1 Tax=Belonocnema kinseyi TaxID=2817044 RepID=UPI00143D387A|nr:uncharacterized protein LOC117174547 [Belonocnema kinseyi]